MTRAQAAPRGWDAAALAAMRGCFARCTVVSVADQLVDRAAEHRLRAAEAIHLATALAVLDAESVLVTWDKRLRQVGAQAGLVTAPAED